MTRAEREFKTGMLALIAKTDPTFPLRGSPFHALDQLCGRRVSLVTNTIVLLKPCSWSAERSRNPPG